MTIGLFRLFLEDFVYRFWMRPDDGVAWSAALLGVLLALFALAPPRLIDACLSIRRSRFLGALAVTAALLSGFYVFHFLRGGPRIVDSTSYWLQARLLSEGHFTWPLDLPTASYRGRFLLAHDGRIGGIFPPGYPLLLSLGFRLGVPMAIGPLLAALHVYATYFLAREFVADASPESREAVGRGAALLSVFSIGLRYHTADTMSHGATGLAVTLALFFALRGRRESSTRDFALAGLFVGAAASMRLVSTFSIFGITLLLALFSVSRVKHLFALLVAMLPGVMLIVAAQWAVTGSPFHSTQLAYYAASDGPPGCFRYGFGQGIGCVFEHGDFVEHRLKHGHTLAEALETTAFRLKFHMADALNVELLSVVLLPFVFLRSMFRRGTALAVLLVIGQIAAYLPFYFDGSYPGGGGRFYADILGVELALVASVFLFQRKPGWAFRALFVVSGLMLLGFGTRSIREHRLLRDRDGGLPAYQPKLAPNTGILFVDTDAAFSLAFDPAPDALPVARYRGDAHDWQLFKKLGKRVSFHYDFGEKEPKVVPYTPAESFRFESEVDWPPLSQSGGYAIPYWPGCASGQRALVAIPTSSEVRAAIELPILEAGTYSVTPQIVDRAKKAHGRLELRDADGMLRTTWEWNDKDEETCRALETRELNLTVGAATLTLSGTGGEVALDAVDAKLR